MKGFNPLILAAASTVAVFAQSEHPADKAKAQSTQSKPAAAAPKTAARPAGGGGMVVVVDPATGQIREATAAEIGAAGASSPGPSSAQTSANQVAPIAPVGQPGPGGSVILTLDGSSDTFSVMTKGPDGKLSMECVTGEAAAAKRLAATPQKKKEALDEK